MDDNMQNKMFLSIRLQLQGKKPTKDIDSDPGVQMLVADWRRPEVSETNEVFVGE